MIYSHADESSLRSGGAQADVWALLGERAGDNAQVERLVDVAGWPARRIRLSYNRLAQGRNLMLGASLKSLRTIEPPLEPPWPALVVAIGRRSVPAARWIRTQSGGRTRLVQLGRPQAPLGWFDLVITTPQYGLPIRRNVVRLPLPLSRVTREGLAQAAAPWRERLGPLATPRIALLIGGPSKSARLSAKEAMGALRLAEARRREIGGSLLVSTAPRTPVEVAERLERALPEGATLQRWDRPSPGPDPYLAFLAYADEALVTEDSVSALADAGAAGLTARVIELPPTGAARWSAAAHSPAGRRLVGPLEAAGLLPTAPDLTRLRDELVRVGHARLIEGGFVVRAAEAQAEAEARAIAAVRGLLDQTAPGSGA